ncbi:hypothetical protein [Rhodococcus aetherivorans]|uniref:hypothetical protein n=1 Tax=Rhodococcus aetherivorans TaxID=191292 RepID=UPI00388F32F8
MSETNEEFDRTDLLDTHRLCETIAPFFQALIQVQELTGEPYDAAESAEEFLDMLRAPEASADEAWSPEDGPRWRDMSVREQANMQIAVHNASDGTC